MNDLEKIYPDKFSAFPSKRKYIFRGGFKKFPDPGTKLFETVNEIYKEGISLIKPYLSHKRFEVSKIPSSLIPAKFKGITHISFFASTIGEELDIAIENYMNEENVLKGSLLNAWGSESIEAINEWFDTLLREKFGKGTMRFSPGYGDINVIQNVQLIKLLEETTIKSDPETGILTPRKSTTCMIGWY